ncbi:hypothetical protein [Aureimonas mangrovi]|nr:hypothetical protein [Aureimonas mangrovi]
MAEVILLDDTCVKALATGDRRSFFFKKIKQVSHLVRQLQIPRS